MRERYGPRMWPSKPSEVMRRGALQSCVPSEMSERNTSRKSDVVCKAACLSGRGWGGGPQLCMLPESPQQGVHTLPVWESLLGRVPESLGLSSLSKHAHTMGVFHMCGVCTGRLRSLALVLFLGPVLGGSAKGLEPTTFFLGSIWWSCHLSLAPLFSASVPVYFALHLLHWFQPSESAAPHPPPQSQGCF